MARLIDADALKEYIGAVRAEFDFFDDDERPRYEAHSKAIYLLDLYVDSAPTIDTVSVVHGEWKPFDQAWGRQIWYCTACETSMHMPTKMGKPMYEYCPYCGAKMKGADDE